MVNISQSSTSSTRLKLWALFIAYAIAAGIGIAHHELWGDEIHSWNIAKASNSISDLLANSRYEGHPPVWYIILWIVSRLTHDPAYIQLAQWIIACLVVLILLWYSPLPITAKLLIPFGYFFLFEYGVLSRNYAIGVLFAFSICCILRKEFRYKLLIYYVLLFFMSNTHLVALLLAASLHLYFLVLKFEESKKINEIFKHVLAGTLVFIPALYFIFPPSDSGLSIDALTNKVNSEHLRLISKTPLRVFVPIPAWWEYHFWNSQFLLTFQERNIFLRVFTLLLSIGTLGVTWFIFKNSNKSLLLFFGNLLLSFVVSFIFPLATQRYIGFIYIGFIVALWLMYEEIPVNKNKWLLNALLVIQAIAGIFALTKDIMLPFSNSRRINELINKVPPREKTITDFWCVNTISAFSDKRFYTVGLDSMVSFLQWKKEYKTRVPGVYLNSLEKLFEKERIEKVYLVSTYWQEMIFEIDPLVAGSFRFKMVDKRDGAIDKWSNIYLYEVTPLNGTQ